MTAQVPSSIPTPPAQPKRPPEPPVKRTNKAIKPVSLPPKEDGLILCGSGHRPDKLTGGYARYDIPGGTLERMTDLAAAALTRIPNVKHVISGGALGWDTALALAALGMSIPYTMAIPGPWFGNNWPESNQDRFHFLLEKADNVIYINPSPSFSKVAFQELCEWMVHHSHMTLALWNGSPGGTGNHIKYAESQGQTVRNLWKSWVKYSGL